MKRRQMRAAWLAFSFTLVATTANADTLHGALSTAYKNNPTLNAARAQLRATNEGVPQALSGWRPTISGSGSVGFTESRSRQAGLGSSNRSTKDGSASITVTQRLFNGFKTVNNVKAAESAVLAGRETLRSVEQNILFGTVQAYMNVIRDKQIVALRGKDVRFLEEQVRAAKARLRVGEGTRTDVSLAQSGLAQSLSQLSAARASLEGSKASYVQFVGQQPGKLQSVKAPTKRIPRSLESAVALAYKQHPNVRGARYNQEVAGFNVKATEGEFLPTVSLQGQYQRNFSDGSTDSNSDTATLTANVTVPIYSGGLRFSQVRQNKEVLSQRRIQVNEERDGVRSRLSTAWAQFESAAAQIKAARSAVSASQVAVQGSIEERKVGQKTTLDVLDAQSDLITAQISLAGAERDRVVAGYNILAEIGALTGDKIGVAKASGIKPVEFHYKKVRDKWFGLRTTSGQ